MEENKMNTGQYYFDKLPKDIQEKFKANYANQHGAKEFEKYLSLHYESHFRFISGGSSKNYISWAFFL